MPIKNLIFRRFNYIFFLFGSFWKILTGKRAGYGIKFDGSTYGAEAGDKLLPYYHMLTSRYNSGRGRYWHYLGHLHSSAKGLEFRKVLLNGWESLFSFAVLRKSLIFAKAAVQVFLLFQNWLVQQKIHHLKKLKIQRKYVITLMDVPESLAGTGRCISSAERYGEDKGMEIFPGVKKEESLAFFLEHGLTFTSTPRHEEDHDIAAEMGCFASHYLLWKKCVELNEPIIILEDDVEFCAPILPLKFKELIHLGRPALPLNARIMEAVPDKYQEVYYPFNYLLGTQAYGIMPHAAQKLINATNKMVVNTVDLFIHSRRNNILYYLPHPTMIGTEFSSICKKDLNVEEI